VIFVNFPSSSPPFSQLEKETGYYPREKTLELKDTHLCAKYFVFFGRNDVLDCPSHGFLPISRLKRLSRVHEVYFSAAFFFFPFHPFFFFFLFLTPGFKLFCFLRETASPSPNYVQ